MFYIIATVLVIISLFFLYNAVSAFNELRKGIRKKVQAKPYMVVLFFILALIFVGLAYMSIIYQSTWDQNWNEFWVDNPPLLSDETKLRAFNVASELREIAMYGTIGLAILFTLSLVTFRRLSAHLFVASISFAVITFLCIILIQYTEPGDVPKLHEQQIVTEKINDSSNQAGDEISLEINQIDEIDKDSIKRYLQNKSTNVLALSHFVREYFKIPRDINGANVDQLRQYTRGLTEIKQNLALVDVPKGAQSTAKLTQEWLQQEINIVTDCLAAKRETGLLGLMIQFNNVMADLIFNRNREHHDTTDKLRKLRSDFKIDSSKEDLNLKSHFSFIK